MKEVSKTMTFVGAAVAVLVLAWFSRPAPATLDTNTLVGAKIYDFDPLAARRLRIVDFNSLTGNPREFEVAMENGSWRIPSKDGYPADASDQMATAANAINGKEILRVVSTEARDHQLYGVLDPTSEQRKIGDEGVGTRVTVEIAEDEGKNTTADLVIGREVKGEPEQRYVRWTNRDIVMIIEVDPENLATSFEKWIEKDLLKLNPWDIQKVHIKDYSFEVVAMLGQRGLEIRPQWDHKSDMTLVYDDSEAEWAAESLLVYDPQAQQYVEKPLAENEEPNSEALNDLKNALDDLRIVDVARKPSGLSADLKAREDFLESSNQDAVQSLVEHGFAPIPTEEGTYEITSSDGEVIVTLNTGVEYVLRFGNVQEEEDASGGPGFSEEGSAEGEAATDGAGEGLNRYIFVLARFNQDAIEQPELAELPPLPEGVTEERPTAAGAEEGDSAEDASAVADASEEDPAADGEADDAETETDPGAEGDSDSGSPEEGAQESEADKILAERKRIEEENQRKQDEYEDKVSQGKKTVQELNDRFGDWYYVVDDAEYRRIRLSREQVVKEKEPEQEATGGADAGAVDAAGFGRPGGAIPGLPDVSGLLDGTDQSAAEDAAAAENAAAAAADAQEGAVAAPVEDETE